MSTPMRPEVKSGFDLLPRHIIETLARKKVPPAELGVHSFKYLINKLIERYYVQFDQSHQRSLIGTNLHETSMLSMEDEKEKLDVIKQLKNKYCGPKEDWNEYHEQLEKAVQDLQKYIIAKIIKLGKDTGDSTDYTDIESNPEKRTYKETEVGQSIGKYKTALRLLLDANTLSWPSLFHLNANHNYRGQIPFRDLLGLYWLAAQEVNAKELESKDIETNLAYAKENFVEVMFEIRRAHNEDSTLHDSTDNPSCAPGTFGRLVSSSVIYNESARLKSNPYTSDLLKIKIGDFVISEIGKMKVDDRIIIGKFLSEEAIFLLDDDEGRQFVRKRVVNRLLGLPPFEAAASEQTLDNLIQFLNQNPGDMTFVLSKMRDPKNTKELRAIVKDMLILHLQSLLVPKELAPDNNLLCKILLDGVNSSLENALKVKKKKEIEEGLQKLRSQVYDLTLEIESIHQEIQNEYAKMMLCPAYYTTGFERIEKLIEVTNDLEHNFQMYYQKTIKRFEGMATSVMVDMMKNGELPGIDEKLEAKVKNELDAIIKRVAESLLTSTTLKRMENIKNNIQVINECCNQKTSQILSRLPLLPGESLVYLQSETSNTVKPPYAEKTKDWAKYCVALSIQSIQKLEYQWTQLVREIDELGLSLKGLAGNSATSNLEPDSNQNKFQALEQRKHQLELQQRVLRQNCEDFSQHSLTLLEDLLTLGKLKLNKQEWDEMAAMIACLLSRPEIQKIYCLFDQTFLSKFKDLLKKHQINIDYINAQNLSLARQMLETVETALPKVETSRTVQNLIFYNDTVLEASDASLNMTDGARYIKRKKVTAVPSEAEEEQNESSAIENEAADDAKKRQEKRIQAQKKSTEALAENLKVISGFIQSSPQSRSEFQDIHIWLNLQQIEKSNEISERMLRYRQEHKLRAEANNQAAAQVEAPVHAVLPSRRIRGRRALVNHDGYIGRYRCINQNDIIAYRQHLEAAKKKETLEIETNKKYLAVFNKYLPTLKAYGYVSLNDEWRSKPLDEYRNLASEAIREQQDAATQMLEQAKVGSFRITAGMVPNQFWVIGKPETGQLIKIPVFITESGFSVRNDEGNTLFIVPSFAQLKRQIQFKLDPNTPILCEQLPDAKDNSEATLSEKKEEQDNSKQLFIFDFDESIVYEHWHRLLSEGNLSWGNTVSIRTIPFGYPSDHQCKYFLVPSSKGWRAVSVKCEDSEDRTVHTKGLGIRYLERTKQLFRAILNQGHHIAINSFSKYPGAIRFVLRELGLTDEEINRRVYLPETNLFEEPTVPADKKNSMIRLSMKYFNIKHYSQVTFVDDDHGNLLFANILNHELPIEERMALIDPNHCSSNNTPDLDPLNIHTRAQAEKNESTHLPIYLDAIEDRLNPDKQKYKAEMQSLKIQIFAAIEQNNQQALIQLLEKVNALPINIDFRMTQLTFPALYHSIRQSNFEAFQLLMKQICVPEIISSNGCSQYDVIGTFIYREKRREKIGYVSQAILLAIQMMDNALQKHNIPIVKKSYQIYQMMYAKYNEQNYQDRYQLFVCSSNFWEEQTGKSFELLKRAVEGIHLIPDKPGPLLFSKSQPLPKITAETKSVQDQLLRAIENGDTFDYFATLAKGAKSFPDEKEFEVILKENRTQELPFYRIIQTGTVAMLEKGSHIHSETMANHIFEILCNNERFWHHKMEDISLWRVLDRLNRAVKSKDLAEFDAAKDIWDELSALYIKYFRFHFPEGYSNPISCEQIMQQWSKKNQLEATDLLKARPGTQNII